MIELGSDPCGRLEAVPPPSALHRSSLPPWADAGGSFPGKPPWRAPIPSKRWSSAWLVPRKASHQSAHSRHQAPGRTQGLWALQPQAQGKFPWQRDSPAFPPASGSWAALPPSGGSRQVTKPPGKPGLTPLGRPPPRYLLGWLCCSAAPLTATCGLCLSGVGVGVLGGVGNGGRPCCPPASAPGSLCPASRHGTRSQVHVT